MKGKKHLGLWGSVIYILFETKDKLVSKLPRAQLRQSGARPNPALQTKIVICMPIFLSWTLFQVFRFILKYTILFIFFKI